MKINKFYRTNLIQSDFFGYDSIQGLLENASCYGESWNVFFAFDSDDEIKAGSILFNLKQLEKEDYINLNLKEKTEDNKKTLRVEHLSLTIKGRKLLDELQLKSKSGQIKKRLIDLVWVITTSIITTLIVLYIKGN